MVNLITSLTKLVERSRFSAFLIVCIDRVGIFGNLIVGFRICLTTIIVVVVASSIRVVLGWVFQLFEFKALVSIVTWLFAVVSSWFGSLRIWFCGLLRHSVYLHLV